MAKLFPEFGLRARRRIWDWCRVNLDGRAAGPGEEVRAGRLIEVFPLEPAESSGPSSTAELRIIAATAEFCAICKPAGLPSARIGGSQRQSAEELVSANWAELVQTWQSSNPGLDWPPAAPQLCNRLDNDTSGLLLWAFGPEQMARLRELEAAGAVKKLYYALVENEAPAGMVLDRALNTANRDTTLVLAEAEPDSARHTVTRRLEVLDNLAGSPRSLLEIMINRGARHQIRAHLASAGYPIVGDALYGKKNGAGTMYLHHFSISFEGFNAFAGPDWPVSIP